MDRLHVEGVAEDERDPLDSGIPVPSGFFCIVVDEQENGRPRPLAEVERREIERALAWTRGHQGRAAELLGISRKTLWQKRRRYGLP